MSWQPTAAHATDRVLGADANDGDAHVFIGAGWLRLG